MAISIYRGRNGGILDQDIWQKSRCHREEPPVIDSSVAPERGCYRRLGTLERETAGDWLATTTPIGGACRHMVVTKIYSRFAGHNMPGIQLVCTMVELPHQFTQRRRAARIGTHLFILKQTSKSINISLTPAKISTDSLLIKRAWKPQVEVRNDNMNLQTFLNWPAVNMIVDSEELIVFHAIVTEMFEDFDSLQETVSRS